MRIISKRKGQRPAQSTISRAVAMSVEAMESRLLMSVSYAGGTYTQNFDTLVTTGTAQPWTNDTTLAGWSLFRQPAPGTAIPTINAGDGTSNAGSFYSFGTGTTAERALGGAASGGAYFGSPASGAVAGWMALAINNGTSSSIPTFNLNYDGEQWRNGGNATAQTMSVEYGFGSAFTDVTTWTPAGTAFDFASPIHTATASALDGNAAANRQANLGGTIAPAGGWAPGSTLWFRWIENNDAGSDHGLALDNVAFSVPVTPVESFTTTGGANIDNAAGGAANEVLNTDGSITLTVTRTASDSNLSNTASVAYTTADGTGVAGTDYTATSGTLTFAAGETVKTINIPVLTRSTPSGDHTFALNLTPTVASGRSALAPSYTVEVEDTRPALVNVAQAEALSSGTVATITSNPVITKILSVGGSSVNGLTYASWSFTVDDGTGSAVIFGPLPAGFTPVVGNTISVTGTWSPFHQIPELGTITDISNTGTAAVPAALDRTVSQFNTSPLPNSIAGHIITVHGVTITGISGTFGTSNLTGTITDSTGSTTLFYWPTSYSVSNEFFNGLAIPTTPVDLTGFVSVFTSGATNTVEFTPISEPGTPERFSMTTSAAASGEADGFRKVTKGDTITVTVTRSESADTGSVHYSLVPDSGVAGVDYTDTSGTLTFAPTETTKTFTITTLNPVTHGDKLFTVKLTNPTGDVGYLPAIIGGLSTIVIVDPTTSHVLTNNSFLQNATVQPAGPRHTTGQTGTADAGLSLFNVEANNTTNGNFASYGVLTYNDSASDPSHLFNLGGNTVGTINSIELEAVAAPASFDVSGPLNVYIVTDTSTSIAWDATTPIKFDKVADATEGVGAQLGTKYLLGTINYDANQVAGAYTPFNLTNLDPAGLALLKSALNSGSKFRIVVTPGNAAASASWLGSNSSVSLQSPVLRLNYSLPSSLPAWLDPASVAAWDAGTHALTVTGPSTIIADPGTDMPVVTVSAGGTLNIAPSNGDTLIHLGGITDNGIVDAKSVAGRSHTNHLVLEIGSAVAAAPVFAIGAAAKFDLEDNDLIAHKTDYATVFNASLAGRNGGAWDGTHGLTSSKAAAFNSANGGEYVALAVQPNDFTFLANPDGNSFNDAGHAIALNPDTDVIIKYTYVGDFNLDGRVDTLDASILGLGFDPATASGYTWGVGDTNFDGAVNTLDAAAFGAQFFGNGTDGSGLDWL